MHHLNWGAAFPNFACGLLSGGLALCGFCWRSLGSCPVFAVVEVAPEGVLCCSKIGGAQLFAVFAFGTVPVSVRVSVRCFGSCLGYVFLVALLVFLLSVYMGLYFPAGLCVSELLGRSRLLLSSSVVMHQFWHILVTCAGKSWCTLHNSLQACWERKRQVAWGITYTI